MLKARIVKPRCSVCGSIIRLSEDRVAEDGKVYHLDPSICFRRIKDKLDKIILAANKATEAFENLEGACEIAGNHMTELSKAMRYDDE